MRNKAYRKGYERERKIVNQFRDKGCLAFRSAGSHSPIDVFVLDPKNNEIILIQAKAGKSYSDKFKSELQGELKSKYGGEYWVKCEVWD